MQSLARHGVGSVAGFFVMTSERRQVERYAWLRFDSKVQIRRSFFKKEWIAVAPFDFSRFGMGIQTDEQFDEGDEVELALELSKESGVVGVPQLRGVVRYKEKHHSRFNYGVEFLFSSRKEKLEIELELTRIEQALRIFESTRVNNTESTMSGA